MQTVALAALNRFYRGEELFDEAVPGSGYAVMAAYLDEAAEQIIREEGLDPNAYCFRVPAWQQQYNDDGVCLGEAGAYSGVAPMHTQGAQWALFGG